MSDFLLNLARRGAGLRPLVRARVGPPAPEPRVEAGQASEARAVRAEATAPAAPLPPERALSPRPATEPGSAARTDSPATASAAASAMPVVQRAPAAAPAIASAATKPAAYLPAGPFEPRPAPLITSHAAHGIEGSAVVTPAVPILRPAAIEEAPSSAVKASTAVAVEEAPSSAVKGSAAVAVEPRNETSPPRSAELSAVVEIVREERRIEAGSATTRPEHRSVAVSVEPALAPNPALEGARAEPEPDRTVHVSIGAIEIHAAASDVPAPSVAVPRSPPGISSGFEEFTRLRSYAPWGR